MKLRIKGSTLRLRLTQSEVGRLDTEGRVDDEVVFGPGMSLHYAIESRGDVDAPNATFANARLTIAVPESIARHWVASDDVGIDAEQPNGGAEPLQISIEKDFACLHRASEDADVYPNPAETRVAGR